RAPPGCLRRAGRVWGGRGGPPPPSPPPAVPPVGRPAPPLVAPVVTPPPAPALAVPSSITVRARRSGLSRRRVLVGAGLTTGLVAGGCGAGVAGLGAGKGATAQRRPPPTRPAPTSPTSLVLPARLASLGFVVQTKGATSCILPPLVSVRAGAFLMGRDPAKDPQGFPDEKPQSSLTLGAFQIGKHAVTVAEYAAFVQQSGHG